MWRRPQIPRQPSLGLAKGDTYDSGQHLPADFAGPPKLMQSKQAPLPLSYRPIKRGVKSDGSATNRSDSSTRSGSDADSTSRIVDFSTSLTAAIGESISPSVPLRYNIARDEQPFFRPSLCDLDDANLQSVAMGLHASLMNQVEEIIAVKGKELQVPDPLNLQERVDQQSRYESELQIAREHHAESEVLIAALNAEQSSRAEEYRRCEAELVHVRKQHDHTKACFETHLIEYKNQSEQMMQLRAKCNALEADVAIRQAESRWSSGSELQELLTRCQRSEIVEQEQQAEIDALVAALQSIEQHRHITGSVSGSWERRASNGGLEKEGEQSVSRLRQDLASAATPPRSAKRRDLGGNRVATAVAAWQSKSPEAKEKPHDAIENMRRKKSTPDREVKDKLRQKANSSRVEHESAGEHSRSPQMDGRLCQIESELECCQTRLATTEELLSQRIADHAHETEELRAALTQALMLPATAANIENTVMPASLSPEPEIEDNTVLRDHEAAGDAAVAAANHRVATYEEEMAATTKAAFSHVTQVAEMQAAMQALREQQAHDNLEVQRWYAAAQAAVENQGEELREEQAEVTRLRGCLQAEARAAEQVHAQASRVAWAAQAVGCEEGQTNSEASLEATDVTEATASGADVPACDIEDISTQPIDAAAAHRSTALALARLRPWGQRRHAPSTVPIEVTCLGPAGCRVPPPIVRAQDSSNSRSSSARRMGLSPALETIPESPEDEAESSVISCPAASCSVSIDTNSSYLESDVSLRIGSVREHLHDIAHDEVAIECHKAAARAAAAEEALAQLQQEHAAVLLILRSGARLPSTGNAGASVGNVASSSQTPSLASASVDDQQASSSWSTSDTGYPPPPRAIARVLATTSGNKDAGSSVSGIEIEELADVHKAVEAEPELASSIVPPEAPALAPRIVQDESCEWQWSPPSLQSSSPLAGADEIQDATKQESPGEQQLQPAPRLLWAEHSSVSNRPSSPMPSSITSTALSSSSAIGSGQPAGSRWSGPAEQLERLKNADRGLDDAMAELARARHSAGLAPAPMSPQPLVRQRLSSGGRSRGGSAERLSLPSSPAACLGAGLHRSNSSCVPRPLSLASSQWAD